MNLRQAYDGWSQQEQNRQLYVKTRDAFRRAWFTLPTNKPCSWYTKDVLALALAETRVVESDKVKSASVMLHVLTWANFAEPKYNPKPDFEIKDVTRLIHLPADKLEKERQRIMAAQQAMPYIEEPQADGSDTGDADKSRQGQPSDRCSEHQQGAGDATAEPVGADSSEIEGTAPCDSHRPDEDDKTTAPEEPTTSDNDELKEETNMEKEKKPRGKQPRQICQIDPDTLQVVKTYDSCIQGCKAAGVKNIDRAIKRLQKAGGWYWQYPEDIDTFADRLKQKQDGQQQPKPRAKKTVVKPSAAVQVAVTDDPTPSTVTEQQPVSETFTPEPLSTFTDEELMEELDRRGFEGELSRRVVFTIGAK